MAGVQSHICKNPEVSQKLEKMFNNQRYSDTTFLVNQQKFHASSHLVSVSSEFLETLLGNHFENCGDREIKMGEIKSENSFSVILQYMYGLEIDFSEVNKAVLCEVLDLAEKYELTNLLKEVKAYLCKLDCFEINSLVILFNTAKKFQLEGLFEKLRNFAYQKAQHLVEHSTFIDLQYDILLDLVKSDSFCMDEIDILKGVLTWHVGNIIDSLPNNDGGLDESVGNEDIKSVREELENTHTASGSECENQSNNNESIPSEINKSANVLKTFSSNILMALLSHIRFEQISSISMLQFSSTELFLRYKEFLTDLKYYSPIKEFGNRLPNIETIEILDVSKEFIVKWPRYDVLYKSNRVFFGQLFWQLCMIATLEVNHIKLTLKLKCISLPVGDYSLKFQIKLISHLTDEAPHLIIPGENMYTTVIINSRNSSKEICNFYLYNEVFDAYNYKTDNTDTLKFEMNWSLHRNS